MINKSSDDLWLSVTYNYILITSISIIILLLLKFSTFTVKRLFRDYELKIYLGLSTLSAIIYFFTDNAPRYFDGLVLLLLALTYYLLFKQKEGTQYNLSYTLLYVNQWLLYSFCLAPMTRGFYQQFETLDNIYLKLLVICTTLFILVNNYLKVRNIREDNKTNKVLNAQYIMMLKTYHKQLKEQLQQSNTENLDTKVKELKNDPRSSKEQLQKQYKLTDREMDVLKLLLDGLTNKEISENLEISESTTKYHISNIYTKLEVSSRNQLFALQLLQI